MGISREQALDCFRSNDLIGIGMEADAVRRRLHPEGVVSYVIDRTVDCADVEEARDGEPAFESACDQTGETLAMGGTGVTLLGILAPGRKIAWFEQLFAGIKQRHPSIWLQSLSAPEVVAIAEGSDASLQDTILRLRDAGLDSIGVEGADITAPEPWLEVHRTAHEAGMRTAAAIAFGGGETTEQRVDCLEAVRQLQEETCGFTAFIPLSFRQPGGRVLDDATAVESLKVLAISRMMLENVENLQSNWATQGLKVRQMGLRFGGNDVGSVTLNGGYEGQEEDLRRIIRDAGFRPVQRDTPYRTMFLN
jgi:cyclic dehypoxanthinyl futalosine synthase